MTLPNFLIIGASKAGTTSLYRYLTQHPDVFMSAVKEPNYFAWDPVNPGMGWWGTSDRRRFPVQDRNSYEGLFADAGEATAIGEASTAYLVSEHAPARIQEMIPNAKLIVSLRNPIDRAYSAYQQSVRGLRETRPVDEAFGFEEYWVQEGLYHRSLERYFRLFPSANIKVLVFEQWTRDPATAFKDVFSFLAIDEGVAVTTDDRYNVGGIPKSTKVERVLRSGTVAELKRLAPRSWVLRAKQLRRRTYEEAAPFPSEIRMRLTEFYQPDIDKLAELTGLDLGMWTQPRLERSP